MSRDRLANIDQVKAALLHQLHVCSAGRVFVRMSFRGSIFVLDDSSIHGVYCSCRHRHQLLAVSCMCPHLQFSAAKIHPQTKGMAAQRRLQAEMQAAIQLASLLPLLLPCLKKRRQQNWRKLHLWRQSPPQQPAGFCQMKTVVMNRVRKNETSSSHTRVMVFECMYSVYSMYSSLADTGCVTLLFFWRVCNDCHLM